MYLYQLVLYAVLSVCLATHVQAHVHNNTKRDSSLIGLSLGEKLARRNPSNHKCGTHEPGPSESYQMMARAFSQRQTSSRTAVPSEKVRAKHGEQRAARFALHSGGKWVFPVRFYDIIESGGTQMSSGRITSQLAVLNSAFSGANFEFILDAHVVIEDTYLFENACSMDPFPAGTYGMPSDYDSSEVVPVFLADCLTEGLFGYSTFPYTYPEDSLFQITIIDYRTLPGDTTNSCSGACEGDTLVHELGHYFNLYHTFQGACAPQGGDFIPDTPASAHATFGCEDVDTCTSDPGNDPGHNFMAYSDDLCLWEFSDDQLYGLRALVGANRPELVSNVLDLSECTGDLSWLSDGWCDEALNTFECDWDGGDCCSTTCTSRVYTCGAHENNIYQCLDPYAAENRCPKPFLVDNGVCNEENMLFPCFEPECASVCEMGSYQDGYCDWRNNNAECGWDGGDCCPSSCLSGLKYDCTSATSQTCSDPSNGGSSSSSYFKGGNDCAWGDDFTSGMSNWESSGTGTFSWDSNDGKDAWDWEGAGSPCVSIPNYDVVTDTTLTMTGSSVPDLTGLDELRVLMIRGRV